MTENQRLTLMKWRARYKRAQLAHSYTAISYSCYHVSLGIMLIILTTASCVLIFAKDLESEWLIPVVSISAALFAYLQTFLQLSENANAHRAVARRYGALKKHIEYIIDFQSEAQDIELQVDTVRRKEEEIATEAPHALRCKWKKAKSETQKENDSASIRNRT